MNKNVEKCLLWIRKEKLEGKKCGIYKIPAYLPILGWSYDPEKVIQYLTLYLSERCYIVERLIHEPFSININWFKQELKENVARVIHTIQHQYPNIKNFNIKFET